MPCTLADGETPCTNFF